MPSAAHKAVLEQIEAQRAAGFEPVDPRTAYDGRVTDFVDDPSELNAEWWLVTPPISWFPIDAKQLDTMYAEYMREEPERMAEIREWLDACSDDVAALDGSPLLAIMDKRGACELVDGYHRLALWIYRNGREQGPPTLVGLLRRSKRAPRNRRE